MKSEALTSYACHPVVLLWSFSTNTTGSF